MNASSRDIFRASAIERLASPEQLDQLITVTRPADWAAALLICCGLAAVIIWSLIGQIPTRVSGVGILISNAGRLVDATAGVGGQLAAVNVEIGDHIAKGQVIARIAQTEVEERHRSATQVLQERERERDELIAAAQRELKIRKANADLQKAALLQLISAAQQRVATLTSEVAGLQALKTKGFVTMRELDERITELSATQQKITEAQNEIQRLDGQLREDESKRQLDELAAKFKVNEARRQMEQLEDILKRDSRVLSPLDGQVFEIKVSPGAVLTPGTPIAAIQTEGTYLEAIVYVPADRGKDIHAGMEVRVEPSSVRREEFGTMIGTVSSISEFPVTPEGMAAQLHNQALVKGFSTSGAPYAVTVKFKRDAAAFSGYRWSSGEGPPLRLSAGTLLRAEITTRRQRPIDLVFPAIRRISGLER